MLPVHGLYRNQTDPRHSGPDETQRELPVWSLGSVVRNTVLSDRIQAAFLTRELFWLFSCRYVAVFHGTVGQTLLLGHALPVSDWPAV